MSHRNHAAHQAAYRARRKAAGRCRQCPEPAAVRSDGIPMSACNKHLDADAERSAARKAARKAKSSE